MTSPSGAARRPPSRQLSLLAGDVAAPGVEDLEGLLCGTGHVVRGSGARADAARLPARTQRDTMLCGEIRRMWEENFQAYGVRKVWRQFAREGIQVVRCTVERLKKRLNQQ